MRQVILYIATSLDGYIARENDAIDFLAGHTDEVVDYGYDQFLSTIDTIILGSKTYLELIHHIAVGAWPYAGKEVFVFSSRLKGSNEEVSFVEGDVVSFVETLKQSPGKDIWIVGGRGVIDPLFKAKAIDRLVLTLIPNIIGSGKRLFPILDSDTPLKLVSNETYNGMVMLTYEKR
jgi:dihydrofolate reductase